MPAPLRTIMVTLWVSSLAGAIVTGFLSAGWIGWMPFAVAGLIGLALGVPAGLFTARKIKRDDPDWPPRRVVHRRVPLHTVPRR